MNPPILVSQKTPVKIKCALPNDGSLCLNLGGAGEGYISGKIQGFITVDLRETVDTDVVSDISDLSWLPNYSCSQIYCSNALEHFPHTDTVNVLKEWNRVLKPKGKLWVSVPDFDAAVRLYQKVGLTEWVAFLVWGDQKAPLNYHYINFTFPTLASKAIQAGFSDIRRVVHFPFGVKDASEHKDNFFNMPISLNVEITK